MAYFSGLSGKVFEPRERSFTVEQPKRGRGLLEAPLQPQRLTARAEKAPRKDSAR